MKKIITLHFLLYFSVLGFSQIYTGKIVDSEKQPVSYANISAFTINDKKLISGVITNDNGDFELKITEGNQFYLEISFIGFETQKIKPTKTSLGTITLKEKYEDLEEIIITARKKLIQKKGDKLYFNVANSPLAQGNSLDELLAKTPKVIKSNNGFKIKNKQAIVLINGQKINLGGQSIQNYLSSFNSENIKRIEIQENADASQDGSTQNGVINIVLKNNYRGFKLISKQAAKYYTSKNQDFYSNWNIQYGDDKFYIYTNLNWNKRKELGDSYTYFYYDDKTKNLSNSRYENNRKYNNVNLGGVYFINPKNEIGISITYNKWKNNYDESGRFAIEKLNTQPILSKGISITKMDVKNKFATFNYTLKLDDEGSELKVLSDIGENKFVNNSSVNIKYIPKMSNDNFTLDEGMSKSNYFSGQIDYNQILNNDFGINVGVRINTIGRKNKQYNYLFENETWNLKNDKNKNFRNKESIIGGYVSGNKQWGKHYIKLGLRVEKTNARGINNITNESIVKNYIDWFPNFYYKYDLNDNLSVNMNYKRSITRPSFTDLTPYVFKINDFQYNEGNPNLEPYYKNSYILGVDYSNHSLTLSYEDTKGYIRDMYMTNSDKINIIKPVNLGIEKIWGADYFYNNDINSWLYFNFSAGINYLHYTLQEKKFKDALLYNELFLQAKISKSWLVSISHYYTSNTIDFNDKLKYDTSVNAMIQKKFLNNALIIRLGISDIFNSKRTSLISYHDNFNYDFYMKPTTRNFLLSIQYNFDNKHKINRKKIESSDENRKRLK